MSGALPPYSQSTPGLGLGLLMDWMQLAWGRRRVRIWLFVVAAVACLLAFSARPEGGWLTQLHGGALVPSVVLLVFGAALLCEYVDSSLGMGYGTALTPVLLMAGFEPVQVVPAVLLSEFLTGIAATLWHHRDGNLNLLVDHEARTTALLIGGLSGMGAVVAVLLAMLLHTKLSSDWLSLIIGLIVLSMGILILVTLRRRFQYRRSHLLAVGAVAAFNKGLSGGGYGPLVTAGQVVSGVSSKQAVGVTSLGEAITCFVGLVAYMLLGGGIHWGLAVPLTAGALLSVPVATLTVRRMGETHLRAIVGVVTCVLGAIVLVKLLF